MTLLMSIANFFMSITNFFIENSHKYFEILKQMDFTQEEAEKICKYNALKMVGWLDK